VLIPPEGYLAEARRICREADVLFVADEVICGYGRVGAWFASTRFDLDPDLLVFAKGITSGYVPLGGVIVSPLVSDPFWKTGDGGVWRHGYTYSGHAVATAAAHANLDIIERESLVERVRSLEGELADALRPLESHPLVSEIRSGLGLVAGIQIDPLLVADDAGLPDRIAVTAREHGVMARTLVGGALQISPAFVITRSEMDEMTSGLAAALDAVAAQEPVAARP
jgi:putrescine aminotransferase